MSHVFPIYVAFSATYKSRLKFLWKNRLSEVTKGHINCLLEKCPQQCRSGILHIRHEHI